MAPLSFVWGEGSIHQVEARRALPTMKKAWSPLPYPFA